MKEGFLKLRFLLLLIAVGLIAGCPSDDDFAGSLVDNAPTADSCSLVDQNRFIHEVMLDYYLWYRQVDQSIDYASFTSPQQVLDYLRYDTYDPPGRFSYVTDAASHASLFNDGEYQGFGFSYFVGSDDSVVLRFVYDSSAAGRAGMKRGDRLISVDGRSVSQIIAANDWSSAFSPSQIDLVIENESGTSSLTLNKGTVGINTVLHDEIINQGSDVIGYLVFKSFLSTSSAELDAVFGRFSQAGVNKVVLDLRYNGGGLVRIANELASWLRTADTSNDLFIELSYNDKQQEYNTRYQWETKTNGLDIDQLVVIATGSTCSASELMISGLSPYVDVQVVGSATCGKPVGMNGFEFCDLVFLPITFESRNSLGEGGYFDGLSASCSVEDDPAFGFDNRSEPMMEEALHLIANGSCQTATRRSAANAIYPDAASGSLEAIIGAI